MKKPLRENYLRYHIPLVCAFYLVFWCGLLSAPAWAHKVTIFAWVDGDVVHTQSKFSGGKAVKNSEVVVYDEQGAILLRGKTDESGAFSFEIPKKTALKVALEASMGHFAEWIIPLNEIVGGDTDMPGEDAGIQEAGDADPHNERIMVSGNEETSRRVETLDTGLSKEEIQEIIDASLDRKLTPLILELAEAKAQGPGIKEVLAGIGYIFGLVGVALYFSNRRKKG